MREAMMASIAALLFGSGWALAAPVDEPIDYLPPRCAFSVSFDSYGRGLRAGLEKLDLRARLNDEECFALGYWKMVGILEAVDPLGCQREFYSGHRVGFAADREGSWTECFSVGHSAGLADLRIGAREGRVDIVGHACLREYHRGRKDFTESLVRTPRLGRPALDECYSTGYDDASVGIASVAG